MLLIGIFEDTNKKIQGNIYHDWETWHKDIFSPATRIISIFSLTVFGKNYKEKKEDLRLKALCYQDTFNYVDWSYKEITEISNFFYKNGKKYGLLREFKENGII